MEFLNYAVHFVASQNPSHVLRRHETTADLWGHVFYSYSGLNFKPFKKVALCYGK